MHFRCWCWGIVWVMKKIRFLYLIWCTGHTEQKFYKNTVVQKRNSCTKRNLIRASSNDRTFSSWTFKIAGNKKNYRLPKSKIIKASFGCLPLPIYSRNYTNVIKLSAVLQVASKRGLLLLLFTQFLYISCICIANSACYEIHRPVALFGFTAYKSIAALLRAHL